MTAPPPVMVTFPLSIPTYTYAREKLWLTYGIAVILSFASTFFGTAVMLVRGQSFDCSFSTILRRTRHAELDTDVDESDAGGTAPLPKYLAKTRIRFANPGNSNDDEDDSDSALEMAPFPSQEPFLPLPMPTEETSNRSVSSDRGDDISHSFSVSTTTTVNPHGFPS